MENNIHAHHPFGPSSLERRELCPASYRLEDGLPSVSSEHAEEGTRLHAEIAELIHREREELIYQDCIPEEDRDMLLAAYGLFRSVLDECGIFSVYVERRLSFSYLGMELLFGRSDVVIVTDDRVVIIDWKFGHRQVEEAANNIQGAAYALSAMQEFKKDKSEVIFFNPRIRQLSRHLFTDRTGMTRYVIGVIGACKLDNARAVPGEVQCRYCKAAAHGTCPALARDTELMADKAEALVPLPSLAELSADELVSLKRKCDLIAKLGERVDNRIRAICEESGSCGCFKIKEVSGGREMKDIGAAYAKLKGLFSAEEFLSFCSLSVSKLEKGFAKALKEKGMAGTEKAAKEVFAVDFDALIEVRPPKKNLVAQK